MRTIAPTPPSVVDARGEVQFGVFAQPFEKINMEEAALRTGGLRWPRALRKLRLKEWQHVWVATDEIFFGLAAVDAKYLKNGFSYAVERETGRFFEHSCESVTAKVRIPRELWDARGHFTAKGFSLDMHSHLRAGEFRYRFEAPAGKHGPSLKADLRLLCDLERVQPLVVVLPIGPNQGMYSHKSVLPVEGYVDVDGRRYALDPTKARAIIDVHKAHYPYRTWWNWATFCGRDDKGRDIGLNLTRNVCLDQELHNENGLWIEGRLHRLAAATLEHPAGDTTAPWTIGTTDGAAQLRFIPEGERHGEIQAGVLASSFHQPYGRYEGHITLPDGEVVRIAEAVGVAEDHVTRW